MSVTVIKAGILDTIQDEGRHGYSKWGINANGAMDTVALQLANALAGNDAVMPTLECHFPSPELRFQTSAVISITGADFGATIDGYPVSPWRTVFVPKDSILKFTAQRWGMRAYIGFQGGLKVAPWLNSASTNIKSGLGGFAGRKLLSGDVIPLSEGLPALHSDRLHIAPWFVNFASFYAGNEISFLPGREWHLVDAAGKEALCEEPVIVDSTSDRMATQLLHRQIKSPGRELLSSAVSMGTMQLLPSGKVIVLMADHQTTGGYPRIGHVITANLHHLAQQRPGDRLKLKLVSNDVAEKSLFSMRKDLGKVVTSVRQHYKKYAVD